MLNNPRPYRFSVILSGGEEHVQNRAAWPAAPGSNSRRVQPCQWGQDTALTCRPYFAEDSPEPGGRGLLHPRVEEQEEKPGGETCSPAPFLPLFPPPALAVPCPTPAAGTWDSARGMRRQAVCRSAGTSAASLCPLPD